MKEIKGCFVALITPFNKDGSVNYHKIEELVEKHIQWKTSGLVPLGTTGETPTLTNDEYVKVLEIVIRTVNKRIPVFVGTGSNSTDRAVELTKLAKEKGADGSLIVLPYYNKPSQKGLYLHFKKLNEVGFPLIAYNVPGRTSVNLLPETFKDILKDCPNVIAIKESSGNLDQISEIAAISGNRCRVMSGDDSLTLPLLAVGGMGIISVAGNIIPDIINQMITEFSSGNLKEALAIHRKIFTLCKSLLAFDANPVPLKAAMNMIGYDVGNPRLPLTNMSEQLELKLRHMLVDLELIK